VFRINGIPKTHWHVRDKAEQKRAGASKSSSCRDERSIQVCYTSCVFLVLIAYRVRAVLGFIAYAVTASGRENRCLNLLAVTCIWWEITYIDGYNICHSKEGGESCSNLGRESGVLNFLVLDARQ